MKLNQNKSLFEEIVATTAYEMNLASYQVEKDYYVSLILKELAKIKEITIVFKGGTSLSKCYNVIDRFSEDIDIAVLFEEIRFSDSKRKKLKSEILNIVKSLGFTLLNENYIRSRRDFNKYDIGYNNIFRASKLMIDHIVIETIVVYKPYPYKLLEVNNYITNYLLKENQSNLIINYELEPFQMMVQTIERTFIDKIFAICDYHLQNNYLRHSRHIYDLHKIWISGLLNSSIITDIMEAVVEDRQKYGLQNLSCLPGQKPLEILKEIYENNVFEKDYKEITSVFIYKPTSYEEAIKSLFEIIKSNLIIDIIPKY